MKYLGIDIGGQNKTWVCMLYDSDKQLNINQLQPVTLREASDLAKNANSIAIDAQLTFDINCENGFRHSDDLLRLLLSENNGKKEWVASYNSLMAVPIRGKILFDELIDCKKPVFETHPRADLLFKLRGNHLCVSNYKNDNPICLSILKNNWLHSFNIQDHNDLLNSPNLNDDKLDALVCATIAYLALNHNEQLKNLTRENGDNQRGDFLVIQPPA